MASRSARQSSTRSRKVQAAANVLVNDTRRRVRNQSKDLSSTEIEFRLGLARANLANAQVQIVEVSADLHALRKSATDTQHIIAELEQLLGERA